MAKANPTAYFANRYMGTIKVGKVDKWARFHATTKPYFDTWQEAHDWLLDQVSKQAERAAKEALSASRRLAKVAAMTPPRQLTAQES